MTRRTRRVAVEAPSTDTSYEVVIGDGLLEESGERLAPYLRGGPVFLVSDATVQGLYGPTVAERLGEAGFECIDLVIEPGEASKSREVLAQLQDSVLEHAVDRKSTVIALGGGVPGDLAGYLAASLLRGLPWVQLPTSLLAMVDSSVGGKTGVDTPAGKNLIGAFWNPAAVMADVGVLKSLPEAELAAGMAEVIKYGVILEEGLFTDLEDGLLESCLARVPEALAMVVERCVATKAAVVRADLRESNRRQVLNFGHTVGHAIEAATDYSIRHGEAVAIGMTAAARLSERRFGALDLSGRVRELCARAGLPTALPEGVEAETVVALARADKKGQGNEIRCVLVREIGDVTDHEGSWSHPVEPAELIEALSA